MAGNVKGWLRCERDDLTRLALVEVQFTFSRTMQSAAPASGEASELALFLKALVEEGRAVVQSSAQLGDAPDAVDVLRQLDLIAHAELSLEAPRFSEPTAAWAARLFYQLCQFTVCRDISAAQINAACNVPCPETRGPEMDWSADLTLRHLPKLFQLARHLSQADPLVQHMKQIAAAWPLSSVGIPDLENLQLESFIEHSGLRRLYADRIVVVEDTSRLNDPRVESMLRADLGIHHELAPALAAKLYPINS